MRRPPTYVPLVEPQIRDIPHAIPALQLGMRIGYALLGDDDVVVFPTPKMRNHGRHGIALASEQAATDDLERGNGGPGRRDSRQVEPRGWHGRGWIGRALG